MIADSMRLAIRDSVLVALAVAVIVLAWWPRLGPRQLVHVRSETGNPRAFSIPLDDPRLGKIRQQIFNRAHPRPRTEWVLARWRRRLASHYIAYRSAPQQTDAAARNERPGEKVIRASFTGPAAAGVASAAEPDAHPASQQYWMRQRARAERTIEAEQRRFARQRAAAGLPPVALGDVVAGQRRHGAWITALASGLLAAWVFVQWTLRWPALAAIRGRRRTGRHVAAEEAEEAAVSGRSAPASGPCPGETAAVRIEIPAQWVRVSQPLPVALRRWALMLVVLAALSSVWV